MDLTPGQRKAAFAVVVLALAGLGIFLLAPGSPSARSRAGGGGRDTASPASRAAPATTGASPAAPATPLPAAGGVDIYRWLPFTRAGLSAAAAQVQAFAAEYATYTYTETAAVYVGRMKGLVTPQLAALLGRAFATPGVAQQRDQQKQTAVGNGEIAALRAFGPSSLTFLVTVRQRITDTSGSRRVAASYAVTVTGAGTTWQVSDIEPASAGNA